MNETFSHDWKRDRSCREGDYSRPVYIPSNTERARLPTYLWCLKKKIDASGGVWPLSPQVSVYSCFWMIVLDDFLKQLVSLFDYRGKLCSLLTARSRHHSVIDPLPANKCGWGAILKCIRVHLYLFVREVISWRSAGKHTLYWWSTFGNPHPLLITQYNKL